MFTRGARSIAPSPWCSSSDQVHTFSPWTNSAPISIGCGARSKAVCTRPPTRSRASRTITSKPSSWSARAAARPAAPAPTTRTLVPLFAATPNPNAVRLGLAGAVQFDERDVLGAEVDGDDEGARRHDLRMLLDAARPHDAHVPPPRTGI